MPCAEDLGLTRVPRAEDLGLTRVPCAEDLGSSEAFYKPCCLNTFTGYFSRRVLWLLQLPTPRSRPGRKKDGSQSGGGGAYFEPTVSRRATSVEQASSVPCHVPGFSRQSATGMVLDKVTVHFCTLATCMVLDMVTIHFCALATGMVLDMVTVYFCALATGMVLDMVTVYFVSFDSLWMLFKMCPVTFCPSGLFIMCPVTFYLPVGC